MSTKAPAKARPEPPRNILVDQNPADTLNACVSVLWLVEDLATSLDLQTNNQTVGDGFRWVMMMVRDALNYEADRAQRERPE